MKQCKIHTGWLVTAMVVILLVIDQIIKLYIKTHFYLGESVRVTDWFFIDFVENNGMAWGMSFINKLTLSLVRTVAIIVLLCYLRNTQNYIHLAAHGLTLFDLAPGRVARDLEQWQGICTWLDA